jgi:calcineurin-like phosphoesterase family protein
VHGHCHGNLHHGEDANYYWNRRAIDAGCMLHDYKPISYTQVIEKLSQVVLPTLTIKV